MSTTLTAEQAAQRLLDVLETVASSSLQPKANSKGNAKKHTPDSSSISWAFHNSVDTTGLLNWLSINIDAVNNGLCEDELELLAYLDRIDYKPSASSKNGTDSSEAILPSFELQKEKARTEANVLRLENYAETLKSQNTMLKSRLDSVSAELSGILEEEERLKRSIKASNSEVSRLTSAYTGVLDETSLAAKNLMDRLQLEGCKKSSYFYQNKEAIDRLEASLHSYLDKQNERISEQLKYADDLPAPWNEFQPLCTQNITDLLQTSRKEYEGLNKAAAEMAIEKLALDTEQKLIHLCEEEVDRAQGTDYTGVNQQSMEKEFKDFEECLNASIAQYRDSIVTATLEKTVDAMAVPLHTSNLLKQLGSLNRDLADIQSARLAQVLDLVLEDLKPQQQALTAIWQSLAAEHNMLDGWARLWQTVSGSLDKENAELEKLQATLNKHAATDSSTNVIALEDVLALSLKRLLDIYRQVSQPLLASSSEKSLDELVNIDSDDLSAILAAGAFTSWESLVSDAKAHAQQYSRVQTAISARVKQLSGIEQQIDCSLSDLTAAMHGGDTYSGSESVDVLPLDVRDSLGDLKQHASMLRKRVTKASMLAEEPQKAVSSNYAALFCQYYS
ncbi:hypothetical protein LPJ68_002770 [Coemansia sp. RSA 1086]|nr:hypothetical protein LPJ68_002770 [Coemansia sp. RSA 1086]